MNAQSQDTVTFLLSTLTGLLVLSGLAVRFVLLPWLRDKLVDPVHQVHRQVSENGGRHVPATIPDKLDDLSARVEEAAEAHVVQARDTAKLSRSLDEHLRWADRWTELVTRELELLKAQLKGEQKP